MPYVLRLQTAYLKQRIIAYNELSAWLADLETGTGLGMPSSFILVN